MSCARKALKLEALRTLQKELSIPVSFSNKAEIIFPGLWQKILQNNSMLRSHRNDHKWRFIYSSPLLITIISKDTTSEYHGCITYYVFWACLTKHVRRRFGIGGNTLNQLGVALWSTALHKWPHDTPGEKWVEHRESSWIRVRLSD